MFQCGVLGVLWLAANLLTLTFPLLKSCRLFREINPSKWNARKPKSVSRVPVTTPLDVRGAYGEIRLEGVRGTGVPGPQHLDGADEIDGELQL